MRISDWSSDVCSSDLDWRPFAYVRNHILINELTSPLVVLVRPPEMKPVPSDPDAPLLPDLDIDVGNLTVDRLLIGRAVRSEERWGGKGCVSTCRYLWSPYC